MNRSTWQRTKKIFDQARALEQVERAAFLDRTCLDNQELRDEVEKLLGSYDSEFLEEPALDAESAFGNTDLANGQMIGRYKIGKLIGSGGMGQVYAADDLELDRPVAFKVLHREVAEDTERVRRFIQEARAASALNHPNILTIHEIGSFDGARYIVSEYVNGSTLRERMQTGLTAAESVDIACQVTAALQTAHSAGIVHRDIKPENVMVRRDGLVKVLDFGLAKLTERDDRPIDPNASAASPVHTSPGLVMGTVAYMSPEQARGQSVDARTDLWSLGVVLHEMLTGSSPFEGETVTELFSSILKTGGKPPTADRLPPGMRSICRKALTEDKDSRYRSAHDLLKDLEGEKKRMEYAVQSTRYISVSTTDELKTQLIRPRRTLSAEYIVTSVKRHKFATLATAVLVVTGAVGLSVYKYRGATPPDLRQPVVAINDSTLEGDLKISKLPISGQATSLAISRDGKYVAYSPDDGIRLFERETGKETVLLANGYVWGLNFSPDGQFVYYGFQEGLSARSALMRVSIQGSSPAKVADAPLYSATFSPDGATMVFSRKSSAGSEGAVLLLASPDGSNERTLASTSPDDFIFRNLIFSPDGRTVAAIMQSKDQGGSYMKLVGFDVANGRRSVISEKRFERVWPGAWLPNGNLVVTAQENYSSHAQVWSITTGGEARAITSGLVNYHEISATNSGDILATRQVSDPDSRDLWVYPKNDFSNGKQVTTSGEVRGRFALTPDGRVVFSSDVSGDRELWIMNADGSNRKQLTRDPGGDVQPAISPDGKQIAFTSNRVNGVDNIFQMDINGGNLKQLTNGKQHILPSFSPDGKWIFFVEPPTNTIWKLSLSGGEPTMVATAPEGWGMTGIDINRANGDLVYGLNRFVDGSGRLWKVGVLSVKYGSKLIDVPAGNFNAGRPRWAPDNRTIVIGGDNNYWGLSADGKSKPRQVTNFSPPGPSDPRWTLDGKQLFVSRGIYMSNPVLIQNTGN